MKNIRNKEIVKSIKEILSEILEAKGLELFDITFRGERGEKVLRITIDRPDSNPSLDDCSEVSRELSAVLDENEDIIPDDNYCLEVSSPGMERPLRKGADFVRFQGKKCTLTTKAKDSTGRKSYTGIIEEAGDESFVLFVEKENARFTLSYDNIKKAILVIEF